MKTIILNVNIVVPDKDRIIENSTIVIDNGLISIIDEGIKYRYDYKVNILIDGEGGYLIPGIINHHSHGFTLGPLFPSASKPMSFDNIFYYLNKHLVQGTTTLLSVDGFAAMEEKELINMLYPIKIQTATSHTDLNIKAAKLVDGEGFSGAHEALSIKEMVNRGAVAIGEIGGGCTLGGSSASYYYLPKGIEEKIGKRITSEQGEKLKSAIYGRDMNVTSVDRKRVKEIITQIGIGNLITVDETIEVANKVVYSSVEVAREGIKEAVNIAKEYDDLPMIVHNAAASREIVLEAAKILGPKLIAGHSNHPSFEKKEIFTVIKDLRKYGALIDLCSGDCFGAKQVFTSDFIDINLELIREGMVDLISTDFMGGNWDPMLLLIEKAVNENIVSLPKAISMLTSNVVKAIPKLAVNCGTIGINKTADLVILDRNKISKVNYVLINGVPVVDKSEIKAPKPHWVL